MTRPALLLDLDGTIIDSRPGITASLRAALRDLGHRPDPEQDLTWIIGPPMEQVIGRLLAPYGDDRTQLAVDRYRANYARDGLAGNAVYPGMAEAIAELAGSHELFVCTAKRTRFAVPILENLGLAGHFRAIHGTEDDGRFDDKAVLAAHILASHGLARAGLAGDRLHDIEAAHANHIPAIGVAWGYGGRAELEGAGAAVVVEGAEELIKEARKRVLF